MPDTVSRAEMMAKPFEPIAGGVNEFQNAHSLSYIAFYLGEIDKKMDRIAKALEGVQTSAGLLAALRQQQAMTRR